MSMDRYKRMGLIAELQTQLDAIERRLAGIAGSLSDAHFAVHSHLDTDGAAVEQFGREYRQCQVEGLKIRKRIEELENE